MSELALYRKWRSKNFDELVGQPHITGPLTNAVRSGKVAHAYLFCGPRGTGKTSAAKILAKSLNCEKGPAPCGECAICLGIAAGNILDCIEIDAASNRGIDEIRDLREKVKFAPTQCRYKIYIIDEVHMLTPEAFNALLKTLEEPPPQTVFILCTTEPHKLLPTVVSRCQRFDFKRISHALIKKRLEEIAEAEKLEIDPDATALIAQSAEGSLRDAVRLLDQLRTFCEGRIGANEALQLLGQTPQTALNSFVHSIAGKDLKTALQTVQEILAQGMDLTQLIRDLLNFFRKLLLWKISPGILDASQEDQKLFTEAASLFQPDELYRILRALSELRQDLRYSQHPQLSVEMTLIKLLKAEWEPSLEGLKKRMDLLELRPPAPPQEKIAAEIQLNGGISEASPVSFEALKNGWNTLLEKLETANNGLISVFQDAKPLDLNGGCLVLEFSSEFYKKRLDLKKNDIQKILKDTFSAELDLKGTVKPLEHKAVVREAAKLFAVEPLPLVEPRMEEKNDAAR